MAGDGVYHDDYRRYSYSPDSAVEDSARPSMSSTLPLPRSLMMTMMMTTVMMTVIEEKINKANCVIDPSSAKVLVINIARGTTDPEIESIIRAIS